MSGVATAIVGSAVIGGVASKHASDKSASAAYHSSLAQASAAQEQQSMAIAAARSPQELAALERSLQVQEQALSRQQRLADAIDPTVLEASKQSLQLLRGQEAQVLGPLRDERNRMRTQLMDNLRAQLGGGVETSSIGQQALQKFDMETSSLMSGAQQQSLAQMLGVAQSGSQVGQYDGSGFINVAQGYGNSSGRMVNAINGTGNAMIQSAGSQYVGQMLSAQAQQNQSSQIMGLAGTLGGAYLSREKATEATPTGGTSILYGNPDGSNMQSTVAYGMPTQYGGYLKK